MNNELTYKINENFLNILKGLKDPNKLEAIKIIIAKFKEQIAVDVKFYSNINKVRSVVDKLYDLVDTSDPFLNALIKIEANSPYSIFTYLLNEDFSDIMFYSNGYCLSDSTKVNKVTLDEDIVSIYNLFLNHFIENVMFISQKKFDTANAILDAEINIYRFNMIHKSLTISNQPIIVIRKQTIKSDIHMSEEYIKSLGCSEDQIQAIHKYAQKGNYIIFGEVGSGKTTLLKYMANYKLEEKRNLCIIEDTSELNIDVPISLLTNNRFKIKDLFVATLRENPSSIIIGETRTDEIVDILEAALTINVGTTIHANSFLRAIQRIVFMSIKRDIEPSEIIDLINASVDCFIFMEKRKLKEIWVHKKEVISNIYEAYEQIK